MTMFGTKPKRKPGPGRGRSHAEGRSASPPEAGIPVFPHAENPLSIRWGVKRPRSRGRRILSNLNDNSDPSDRLNHGRDGVLTTDAEIQLEVGGDVLLLLHQAARSVEQRRVGYDWAAEVEAAEEECRHNANMVPEGLLSAPSRPAAQKTEEHEGLTPVLEDEDDMFIYPAPVPTPQAILPPPDAPDPTPEAPLPHH